MEGHRDDSPEALADLDAAALALTVGARAAEPDLTATLSRLSIKTGGELVGLEHRIKTMERIAEKIGTDLANLEAAGTPSTAYEVAANICDAIRYTLVLEPQAYLEGYSAVVSELDSLGIAPRKAAKNFWKDKGYQAVHYIGFTREGMSFEVQFHTPRSYATKAETRALYEEQRKSSTTTADRLRLEAEKEALWTAVCADPPPGALSL